MLAARGVTLVCGILSVAAFWAGPVSASQLGGFTVRIDTEGRDWKWDFSQLKYTPTRIEADYAIGEANEDDIARLRARGFEVEVLPPEALSGQAALGSKRTLSEYHTYATMRAELQQIAADHPGITRLRSIGTSVQNRELLAVKVTDNPDVAEPEAAFQLWGPVHGNEKIGVEVCMYMINYLTDNYNTNPTVRNLVNNREIWIAPMPNPDGGEDSRRENANGVDLNRDFGYMWEGWGGSPAPYSQPETRALFELAQQVPYVSCIGYHSGTEFVSFPWSFHPDHTPDHSLFQLIWGTYGSMAGYPADQGWWGMYEIHGCSKDMNYGCDGAFGTSIELSYYYTPPSSQIDQICLDNREAILYEIDMVGKGLGGVVTDAVTGDPLAATINISEIGWPVFADPAAGDYHRLLLTGTYTVQAWASGYETKTIPNVQVDQNTLTTLNIQLNPGAPDYLHNVVSCDIADPNDRHNNHTLTASALGPADGTSLSIGVDGWIVFDMGAGHELVDGSGKDFTVYEGDATMEGYSVSAGNNPHGPWNLVGAGRGTMQFDLQESGLSSARYVRIEDDGDGDPNESNPGFDLNALHSGAPSLVSVDLAPDATVVRRGESLGFDATILNTSFVTLTFEAWTEATMPSGHPYPGNPTLGPTTVTLGPRGGFTRHFRHGIPTNAPLGTYEYAGKVGGYPGSVLGEDSFSFTVVP
jgi:hypothetical protein